MNEIIHSIICDKLETDELYHHGILGMHWGIRRFQPYGKGGYDPDNKGKFVGKDKRLYDKELKKNIKKRDEIVKNATIAALNRTSSAKRIAKYQIKKTENAKGHYDDNIARAQQAYDYWDKQYKKLEIRGKQITTRLKNKYGDAKVSDLPYKNGIIRGSVFSPAEATIRSAITIAAIATISPTTALLAMPSKKVKATIQKVKSERDSGIISDSKIDAAILKAYDTMEAAKDKAISTINKIKADKERR